MVPKLRIICKNIYNSTFSIIFDVTVKVVPLCIHLLHCILDSTLDTPTEKICIISYGTTDTLMVKKMHNSVNLEYNSLGIYLIKKKIKNI